MKNSEGIKFDVLVDESHLNDLTNFVNEACTRATKEHIGMCLDSIADIGRSLTL